MIKSRRPASDPMQSCARCQHLKRMIVNYRSNEGLIVCAIDAAECPDLTLWTCDKFKEVRT